MLSINLLLPPGMKNRMLKVSMRKIQLICLLFLIPAVVYSQTVAHMNSGLVQSLAENPTSEQLVPLLVKGNMELINNQTKQLGGFFKYHVGDIAAIKLPLNKVPELAALKGIFNIEGLYGKGILQDDMTFVNANVNPVHWGFPPLTQSYDGSGVVMAILDDGIDFLHPDFKNADGTTRIKFLWDQTATEGGTVPQPYDYGQEWDATAIEAGQCTHVEPAYYFGHGSNVSGIAAGNGFAINNFAGVAPACDLISIAVGMDENFLTNVVDAVKYAFDKAAAIGKPCVINASIGTYAGSHDGGDLAAQMIDALITQQTGRSFVCAAGNAGNIPFHLGYQTTADSSFTWFKYNSATGNISYEWWIDKNEATGFAFSIGADNTSPYLFAGRTKYYNLLNDFNLSSGSFTLKDTLWNGTTRVGIITMKGYAFDSTYSCVVSIVPDFNNYYWRFITNGTGRFDLWSGLSTTGTSDMVLSLPGVADFPDIARYHLPDTHQTIVSSFTCSDHVIAVGNYTNRTAYVDFYNDLITYPLDTTGELAVTSSFGPTRDGRIKPDVAAPGNRTLATGQLSQVTALILSQPYKVALGGMHNVNGGTSMASPVVAGIAALYLQKNPIASAKEVKDAILVSCFKDQFTGNNLPDNTWGFGKVDAFTTMISNVIYGCTDPTSFNYNPLATIDDGSCLPVVFGCTDSAALNYDPAANVNNGSCTYNTGLPATSQTGLTVMAFPNPSSAVIHFAFQTSKPENGTILLEDVSGIMIQRIPFNSSKEIITCALHLPAGLYFYHFETATTSSALQKLVIY